MQHLIDSVLQQQTEAKEKEELDQQAKTHAYSEGKNAVYPWMESFILSGNSAKLGAFLTARLNGDRNAHWKLWEHQQISSQSIGFEVLQKGSPLLAEYNRWSSDLREKFVSGFIEELTKQYSRILSKVNEVRAKV